MSNYTPSQTNDIKPGHEQIATRAELLWKAKGSPEGRDQEIWLEAEKQLFEEAKEMTSSTAGPISSEDPNPAMGAQSSAAEEMKSATPPKSSRRKNGR